MQIVLLLNFVCFYVCSMSLIGLKNEKPVKIENNASSLFEIEKWKKVQLGQWYWVLYLLLLLLLLLLS